MKKIIASFMTFCLLCLNSIPAFADGGWHCQCPSNECIISQEHLCLNKKAPVHTVTITNYRKIICAKNVMPVSFECCFNSKCACAGGVINFVVPESIYTEEGTLIIPGCSKLVAEIVKMQQPKWFNKNARVSLIFRCIILSDGRVMPIDARPFTKECVLMEGPWMTTGKIVLSTVTLGIIGAGAGVGFGFIPSPTKIGVGLAAGIPTGAGIGLLAALISKGLSYKAKAGEQIYIIFMEDASICN